ncbi:MAG: hypothetical protein H6604_08250 [Flavobacteriales bacterium]|nr:hypothetical protein [Flavobacteriales bacterium]
MRRIKKNSFSYFLLAVWIFSFWNYAFTFHTHEFNTHYQLKQNNKKEATQIYAFCKECKIIANFFNQHYYVSELYNSQETTLFIGVLESEYQFFCFNQKISLRKGRAPPEIVI